MPSSTELRHHGIQWNNAFVYKIAADGKWAPDHFEEQGVVQANQKEELEQKSLDLGRKLVLDKVWSERNRYNIRADVS